MNLKVANVVALDWPHAPCHRFNEIGTYMVTASTYQKEHLFKSREELDLLQEALFALSKKYEWKLEAWAIFPNHYHIIIHSTEDSINLRRLISHFHASTAKVLNQRHNKPGRKVWCNFWDSRLTYENSYLARLNYVMHNPVRHGIVKDARDYRWCSLRWYADHVTTARMRTVESFKTDQLRIQDDFF